MHLNWTLFEKDKFAYFMPTVNLMGPGCARRVGEQVKSLGGSHALIVTDVVLN